MRSPRSRRLILALGAALASVSVAEGRAARADVKQECSAAYDDVQALRKQGKLRAAHGRGVACSKDECAAFIKADCGRWLAEIESSQPTVVFTATDGTGLEITAVRVLVDGEVLQGSLDGKAVAIDPGKHRVRFELAGAAPREQDLTVNEGQKNRAFSVAFAATKAATPAGGAPVVSPSPSAATSLATVREARKGGAPRWAWVAGGGGLVATGVGIALLASTKSGSAIQADGNPTCTKQTATPQCQHELTASNTQEALGAVLAGVGGLALGAAVIGLATSGSKPAPKKQGLTLWLAPAASPYGGGAWVEGRFQ